MLAWWRRFHFEISQNWSPVLFPSFPRFGGFFSSLRSDIRSYFCPEMSKTPNIQPPRELESPYHGGGPASAPLAVEMPPPPPYSPHWNIEPKPGHRWLFRIALSQFLLGASAMAAAIVCVTGESMKLLNGYVMTAVRGSRQKF